MLSRVERLQIVAKGKCSAAHRGFGARMMWVPTIDGMVCQLSEEEEDCFDIRRDAVAAARDFREQAKQKLAEEMGEVF